MYMYRFVVAVAVIVIVVVVICVYFCVVCVCRMKEIEHSSWLGRRQFSRGTIFSRAIFLGDNFPRIRGLCRRVKDN